MRDPLLVLRHHVTGAIERGETVAIEGKPMHDLKPQLIQALRAWVAQRPGLEFGNYGDWPAYRSEVRSIGKDLQHARKLIDYVAWHDSITAEMILDAAKSGRLSIVVDGNKVRVDYCTGQYWPTEYRPAVCRLLSSVIWYWMRANDPRRSGEMIRKTARRELGASIARRWFK